MTRLSRTSGVCPIDRELSSYQCGNDCLREIVETFCYRAISRSCPLARRREREPRYSRAAPRQACWLDPQTPSAP